MRVPTRSCSNLLVKTKRVLHRCSIHDDDHYLRTRQRRTPQTRQQARANPKSRMSDLLLLRACRVSGVWARPRRRTHHQILLRVRQSRIHRSASPMQTESWVLLRRSRRCPRRYTCCDSAWLSSSLAAHGRGRTAAQPAPWSDCGLHKRT